MSTPSARSKETIYNICFSIISIIRGIKMCDYFSTEIEIVKRKELNNLMKDWKNVINTKGKIIFPDDNRRYAAIDYFNTDGFYPGYFSEKQKVLFIGRESRYSAGGDRILADLEWFKKNGNPNSSTYWRRILYLIYGIKNKGKYNYSDIPYANEILNKMNVENNYGFAIMNISKYSNDANDGGNANYKLINQFLSDSELSKRNFIKEEIELLEPDIIITANLWNGLINDEDLQRVFPNEDFTDISEINGVANLYDFKLGLRKVKILDLYHFSSIGSDETMFYTPTMKLLYN